MQPPSSLDESPDGETSPTPRSDKRFEITSVGRHPRTLKAKVAAQLLDGSTVVATARATGVTASTIHHWTREDEEFRELLEEMETAIIDAVIAERVQTSVRGIRDLSERVYARLRDALESENPRVYMPAIGHVVRFMGPAVGESSLESALASLDANPTAGD